MALTGGMERDACPYCESGKNRYRCNCEKPDHKEMKRRALEIAIKNMEKFCGATSRDRIQKESRRV